MQWAVGWVKPLEKTLTHSPHVLPDYVISLTEGQVVMKRLEGMLYAKPVMKTKFVCEKAGGSNPQRTSI